MAIRNLQTVTTTVTSSATTILVAGTGGGDTAQVMGIQVTNTGAAFTAFTIEVRCGSSAVWTEIASAAGDFSTPLSPMLRVVGAPVTLANAATCFILLLMQGIHEVRLKATCGTSTSAAVNVTMG